MGICGGKEDLSAEEKARRQAEKARSKDLENQMNQERMADNKISKLLLLGAGESGKSTLFKQMIALYGLGFPEEERMTFKPIIAANIIQCIKTLVEQMGAMDVEFSSEDNRALAQLIDEELKDDQELEESMANTIYKVWQDAGVQEVYRRRSEYQLVDSAGYFLDKVQEVGTEKFIPSEQDVLHSRVRTTGIVENEFLIKGNLFKMYDVGGQRNERKKWIHCFEDVTAVLFVCSIAEYDLQLYEDINTNRATEALNLFKEICNSNWFKKTAMMLFLNKKDLFEIKIKTVPLTVCPEYQDYNGTQDFDECCEYVKEQFQSRNTNPNKSIYAHVTCAIDRGNVQFVMDAVNDIIIRTSMKDAGLI
jgi:GTPase SAR1 family protein